MTALAWCWYWRVSRWPLVQWIYGTWLQWIYVTWLIHMCDMTYSYVDVYQDGDSFNGFMWHDLFICVTWLLLHDAGVDVYQYCDSFNEYTWHDFNGYVWHDLFICVTWLIHMCDMTYSYVDVYQDGDSSNENTSTWLIHMCDMTALAWCWFWRVSRWPLIQWICGTWLQWIYVTWLIHMCDMTHS